MATPETERPQPISSNGYRDPLRPVGFGDKLAEIADPIPTVTPREVASAVKRGRKAPEPTSTRDSFDESSQQLIQLKLPSDLVASLRLHSIQNRQTLSEIVLDALTSQTMIHKAWVATRQQQRAG